MAGETGIARGMGCADTKTDAEIMGTASVRPMTRILAKEEKGCVTRRRTATSRAYRCCRSQRLMDGLLVCRKTDPRLCAGCVWHRQPSACGHAMRSGW